MKGGQLVRGGSQCVKQRVFINFCHLNTEYCMSCLLTKLGGGGDPQAPQDSTPTWDHGLHPYVDVFSYQGSNIPESPDRGGKSLWQFLLPFWCDKSIISIKCIHKKVHSTENIYINNTIKP